MSYRRQCGLSSSLGLACNAVPDITTLGQHGTAFHSTDCTYLAFKCIKMATKAAGQLKGGPWKVDGHSKTDKFAARDRALDAEFATAQRAQLDIWKAHEADLHEQERQRKQAYSQLLKQQAAADRERRQQAEAYRRRGPDDATVISTGRHGTAVNTIRTATGELTPYVLEENAVLSTLGTTIRFGVVSAIDGTAIKTARKKSSQYFIE